MDQYETHEHDVLVIGAGGAGLRAALREAPDIILVGEMRDRETIAAALTAAETGHLVFATVHATDAGAAVSRIADAFPAERQNAVRQELAMALAAVLTQTLVPTSSGALVPAAELLMVSYGARQHVRKNALQHLHQEMSITRRQGSITLEDSLGVSRAEAELGWKPRYGDFEAGLAETIDPG